MCAERVEPSTDAVRSTIDRSRANSISVQLRGNELWAVPCASDSRSRKPVTDHFPGGSRHTNVERVLAESERVSRATSTSHFEHSGSSLNYRGEGIRPFQCNEMSGQSSREHTDGVKAWYLHKVQEMGATRHSSAPMPVHPPYPVYPKRNFEPEMLRPDVTPPPQYVRAQDRRISGNFHQPSRDPLPGTYVNNLRTSTLNQDFQTPPPSRAFPMPSSYRPPPGFESEDTTAAIPRYRTRSEHVPKYRSAVDENAVLPSQSSKDVLRSADQYVVGGGRISASVGGASHAAFTPGYIGQSDCIPHVANAQTSYNYSAPAILDDLSVSHRGVPYHSAGGPFRPFHGEDQVSLIPPRPPPARRGPSTQKVDGHARSTLTQKAASRDRGQQMTSPDSHRHHPPRNGESVCAKGNKQSQRQGLSRDKNIDSLSARLQDLEEALRKAAICCKYSAISEPTKICLL